MTKPALTRKFLEDAIAERRGTVWMAKQIGCSHSTILFALEKHGLPRRLPPLVVREDRAQ